MRSAVHKVCPKPYCKALSKREEDETDRRRGRKTTPGSETGLEFAKSHRAVENREQWRKLVAESSVVPQGPSRLRDI